MPIGVGLLLLVLNLKRVFAKIKDGIYLTAEKVSVKTSYITYFVEWQNIKSFRQLEVMGQPLIAIDLFDNDKYLQNRRLVLKKLSKMSVKKYGTPISIPVNLYNVSRFELLSELNYRLEKYRSVTNQNDKQL